MKALIAVVAMAVFASVGTRRSSARVAPSCGRRPSVATLKSRPGTRPGQKCEVEGPAERTLFTHRRR